MVTLVVEARLLHDDSADGLRSQSECSAALGDVYQSANGEWHAAGDALVSLIAHSRLTLVSVWCASKVRF